MAGAHTDPDRRPENAEGGPVKTFLEHLEDFRWVLLKSLVTLAVAMFICLIAGNHIVRVIQWPLTRAKVSYPGTNAVAVVSFGTNHIGNFTLTPALEQCLPPSTNRFVVVQLFPLTLGTNHLLGWNVVQDPRAVADAQKLHVSLINLSPAEGFFVAVQVAFYGGLALASPFIFYFVISFVFPALKLVEKKYVARGLLFGGGLFLAGVSFCYFALMPVALAAAQMYSNWLGFGALQWKADTYISFVCKFMIGMGLGFELPVVLLTLVKIGALSYGTLSKARRYMIVINLVLGAALTTPEVITQLLMFVPLQLLYELTVWIAWYWRYPDRAKARRLLWMWFGIIAAAAILIWYLAATWLHRW